MARQFLHCLRLGTHAEQAYALRGARFYDRLVVNANLVEGTKSAMAVLVTRLQKPYVIDPVTYAFALDPRLLLSRPSREVTSPKRSFAALAEAYGLDTNFLGVRPLNPTDFSDAPAVESFTDRVLDYQRSAIAGALSNDAAFLTSDVGERAALISPVATVPPYFVDDARGAWRSFNIGALLAAAADRREASGGVVAVDSRSITAQSAAELALRYSESAADELFLWLTDFDEHLSTVSELMMYARLVEGLASTGKTILAAYGGFYSLLLAFRGLGGSSHGVGYGDKRNLEPVVGGGLPPARYYLPALRDFINLGDLPLVAASLSPDDFKALVCSCTICRDLVENAGVEGLVRQFTETEDRTSATGRVVAVATPRVYQMTRWHFLEARENEFDLVRREEEDDVLGIVLEGARWASERLGPRSAAHVDRWLEALSIGSTS